MLGRTPGEPAAGVHWNGEKVGAAEAGVDMVFDFRN